jgi:hypothetical protein
MTSDDVNTKNEAAEKVDMKLEVVVFGVPDVDRAALLLKRGKAVRAMVRNEDERAQARGEFKCESSARTTRRSESSRQSSIA